MFRLIAYSPQPGRSPIFFELYRHSDTSRPSLGAIVPSVGGPGPSNTSFSPQIRPGRQADPLAQALGRAFQPRRPLRVALRQR